MQANINALMTVGSRYVVRGAIGKGGMGVVWRAYDRLTGREVALKQVSLVGGTDADSGAHVKTRLVEEFKILASLRHPHIIDVLDFGFHNGQPYYTMTLLDAPRDLATYGKQQPVRARVHLVAQMLQALWYLHRRGVLHRDLKPANALVDGQDAVRLLDFGLATTRAQQSPDDTLVGTPAYIAPEMLRNELYTEQADLYAVGVMLYELLVGKVPFESPTLMGLLGQVLNQPPDLSQLAELPLGAQPANPVAADTRTRLPTPPPADPDATIRLGDLPEAEATPGMPVPPAASIALVVGKLLAKDPTSRYADAATVIAALAAALGEDYPLETSATRESFLQAAQFVGREREQGVLRAALYDALTGHGSALYVTGESGVGKTRLLAALTTVALVRQAAVLRGQTAASVPYSVWRDPLRRLLLMVEPEPIEVSILKDIVPDVASLMGRDIPDAPSMDPAQAAERLHNTVVRMLHRVAQPTVLVLDDLHWATSESLALLARVADAAHGLPLLVLGTWRSDEADTVQKAHLPGTIVPLPRLDADEQRALATAILGEAGARADVLALLMRETEGNAFFFTEVARALADEAGRLDLVGQLTTLPESVVTGGIQHVVQRRLGRVAAADMPLLRVAALLGRVLDADVLRAAAPDVDLDRWLLRVGDAAVLEVVNERWQFAHDKLREGVNATLPAEQERDLAHQAAGALERVHGADATYAATLADLWDKAGDSAKVGVYAHKAGVLAVDRGAYPEAEALFRRLMKQLEPTSHAYTLAKVELAGVLVKTRQFEQADDVMLSLENKVSDGIHKLQIRSTRAEALYLKSSYAEVLALLEPARQASDITYGEYTFLNLTYLALGRLEDALGVGTEALDSITGDEPDNLSKRAPLQSAVGRVYAMQGRVGEARANFARARDANVALGNQAGIATELMNLAVLEGMVGNLGAAAQQLHEAIAICTTTGLAWTAALARANLGIVALRQGRFADAQDAFTQALATFTRLGDVFNTENARLNLGHAHAALSEHAQAQAAYRQALVQAHAAGIVPVVVEALAGLAQVAAATGDTATAQRYARVAVGHPAANPDVTGMVGALADEGAPPPSVEEADDALLRIVEEVRATLTPEGA